MSLKLYLCSRTDEDGYENAALFCFGQAALDFIIRRGSISHSEWKLTILQVNDEEDASELRLRCIPKNIGNYLRYDSLGLDVNSITWHVATDSMFGIKHQDDWYLINLNLKDEDGIYARNIIAERVDFMGEF
jgi:hypothetical protein